MKVLFREVPRGARFRIPELGDCVFIRPLHDMRTVADGGTYMADFFVNAIEITDGGLWQFAADRMVERL